MSATIKRTVKHIAYGSAITHIIALSLLIASTHIDYDESKPKDSYNGNYNNNNNNNDN